MSPGVPIRPIGKRSMIWRRAASMSLVPILPAYAATIHKSQGSEYPPPVVIPILTQHYVMLQRNLLYARIGPIGWRAVLRRYLGRRRGCTGSGRSRYQYRTAGVSPQPGLQRRSITSGLGT